MTEPRILVITPSRGRSGRLTAMLDATLSTSGPGTHVAVCTDADDPDRGGNEQLAADARELWPGRTFWHRGPRKSLAAWTNYLAVSWPRAARYGYLASLGDDHVPRTQGWDGVLTGAIEAMGGTGIAYGDDGWQHENMPTAWVMSAGIVRVLGWLFLPGLGHGYFGDNAIRDLGELAGCLRYCPGVKIIHEHPDAGKAPGDVTYAEAVPSWAGDEQAYLAWGRSPGDDMPSQRDLDVIAVRNVMRLRARTVPGVPA